jgi:uncharacterized protein (DUF736 family)
MLQLKFGIWDNKSGVLSGSFTILGKEFIAFLNKNENKSGNQPDYQVTIKETLKHETK